MPNLSPNRGSSNCSTDGRSGFALVVQKPWHFLPNLWLDSEGIKCDWGLTDFLWDRLLLGPYVRLVNWIEVSSYPSLRFFIKGKKKTELKTCPKRYWSHILTWQQHFLPNIPALLPLPGDASPFHLPAEQHVQLLPNSEKIESAEMSGEVSS